MFTTTDGRRKGVKTLCDYTYASDEVAAVFRAPGALIV